MQHCQCNSVTKDTHQYSPHWTLQLSTEIVSWIFENVATFHLILSYWHQEIGTWLPNGMHPHVLIWPFCASNNITRVECPHFCDYVKRRPAIMWPIVMWPMTGRTSQFPLTQLNRLQEVMKDHRKVTFQSSFITLAQVHEVKACNGY